MDERRLVQQYWLTNLKAAKALWAEVPPEDVTRYLGMWKCGTQACFGGHLATWEHFNRLGVRAGRNNQPILDPTPAVDALKVSQFLSHRHIAWGDNSIALLSDQLFGTIHMFSTRGSCPIDWDIGLSSTDHEIVAHRIDRQMQELFLAMNVIF